MVTIELPEQSAVTEQNERRWAALLADPVIAEIEGRIETDRHGNIIMSPPPAPLHGRYQSKIAQLLQALLPEGEAITELPISTSDGVKAVDVAWASRELIAEQGDATCFRHAPEICVEIISPGNSKRAVEEKMALYFDAGAYEVWLCEKNGAMRFYLAANEESRATSNRCPLFPAQVELPLRSRA